MRGVDAHHPRHAVRIAQRHLPDDEPTPIVTDKNCLVDFQMIEQGNQVSSEIFDAVGFNRFRPFGRAITAMIRRDDSKSRIA